MADGIPSRFSTFADHPRTNLIAGLVVGGLGIVIPGAVAYVMFAAAGLLIVGSRLGVPADPRAVSV
jgi:hypothetical protein